MGWRPLRRSHVAFWLTVGTKDFQCVGQRFGVVPPVEGVRYIFHYLDNSRSQTAHFTRMCGHTCCSQSGMRAGWCSHCRAQGRRPNHLPYIPGDQGGHSFQPTLPPKRQAGPSPGPFGRVGGQERMPTPGTRVLSGHTQPRMQGGPVWPMLDLLYGMPMHPRQPHPIKLNKGFRSDLAWWRQFASEWNGISVLPLPAQLPVRQMASDASGSWGCEAWYGLHWFQLTWDEQSINLPIIMKELLPWLQ